MSDKIEHFEDHFGAANNGRISNNENCENLKCPGPIEGVEVTGQTFRVGPYAFDNNYNGMWWMYKNGCEGFVLDLATISKLEKLLENFFKENM